MVEQTNNNGAREASAETAFEARLKAAREIAEKYGYYYSALSPEEQRLYLEALADPSMEKDIAAWRGLAYSALAKDPNNPETSRLVSRFLKTIDSIERLNKRCPTRENNSRLQHPKSASNCF